MDSSYIVLFRDSTPSFFLHSYLNNIELLSILLQKYNPVATKTDIGGEKMKREDEIEDEIQYAYCPERLPLHSNSIAYTVYSHFEPQKSLMTENDRDLNDRNSR